MIPPSSVSGEFATRAGPAGPADLSHMALKRILGSRRIMSAVKIGDQENSLNEIRCCLVNSQVWFLAADLQRTGENDQRTPTSPTSYQPALPRRAALELLSNWRITSEHDAVAASTLRPAHQSLTPRVSEVFTGSAGNVRRIALPGGVEAKNGDCRSR